MLKRVSGAKEEGEKGNADGENGLFPPLPSGKDGKD